MQSLEVISFNLWQMLISLANLVILFWILKRFLFKPVKKVLAHRQAELDSQYAAAGEAQQKAMQDQQQWAEKLRGAQDEADALLKSAADDARSRGERIVAEARSKADGMIRQAEVRTVELSKSYAAALFSLAAESGEQEEVSRALETVTQVLRENPDYLEFLAAPSIAIDERSAAIDQAFGGRVPEHVASFLQVLCRRGHARSYFDCAKEYRKLCDHANRIAPARITSAVELSGAEKQALVEKLERLSGKIVQPEYIVDETLLGGLIVEMEGRVLDGSLKKDLQQVKEVIVK